MVSLLSLIFDFTSMIVLSVSSGLIVFVLYKYFRAVKIPRFWIYFLAAFMLMTIQNFMANAFTDEPYFMLGMLTKLVANTMIFLAIYSLYKRLAAASL